MTSFREIPSVTALLKTEVLLEAADRHGQSAVTAEIRAAIERLRKQIATDEQPRETPSMETLAARIATTLDTRTRALLRPVINATGVLLHTGLGRAPLARAAAEAAFQAAEAYCSVELDLDTGERSKRSQAVADLLQLVTGAEAAHVVNNNAGALGLALGALAGGREVIVSHGELIEIGGGYRLPEVIETFGGKLRAVGATNKTRVDDYARAINSETAVLLAVHPSNYRVSGFAESPSISALARLAREKNIPFVHDIGSGALIDLGRFGFPDEPVAQASVKAGADLVLFSGDKLLGGPQCGIVVGREDLVQQVMRHPLNRALRVDKVTLAALRATLALYAQGDQALKTVPLLRRMSADADDLRRRAESLAEQLAAADGPWNCKVVEDQAYLGGGTTPEQGLASWSVALTSTTQTAEALARTLRLGDPAIVPRVQHERLIINLHAVEPADDHCLFNAINAALHQGAATT